MKIKLTTLSAFAFLFALPAFGQTSSILIPPNVSLPKDSLIKTQLLTSLNGFLAEKEKPNAENPFVLKEDLLETSVLLDELKGMERNEQLNDDHFYKAYLENVTRQKDTTLLVQLAYLGISEGAPVLRANFTLVARRKGDQFYFLSPLKQNTMAWKSQEIENTNVHFKNSLNTTNAKAYFKLIATFDKKLNAPVQPSEFYCCDNFHEALQLIGVDYKSDYNGRSYSALSADENKRSLSVDGVLTSGFTSFDPHDLWHSRLHRVLSTSVINRPVDEGTAYLYGGSWGLTWKQILEKFKAYANANPNADWLALYNESKLFDGTAMNPLNVDFVINALIVQKTEKEKGFSAVLELLSCGKKEKDNENYFKALEKITGVKKADFNAYVWALIKAS